MEQTILDKIILWLQDTYIYERYLMALPEPLNNPVFDAILLLILLVVFARILLETINTIFFKIRMREKQRELRERELKKELKEAKNAETDDLMKQYMQFMLMAQMQNMSSVMGISFDQWVNMKNEHDTKNTVKNEAVNEPKEDIKEPETIEPVNEEVIIKSDTEEAETVKEAEETIPFELINTDIEELPVDDSITLADFIKNDEPAVEEKVYDEPVNAKEEQSTEDFIQNLLLAKEKESAFNSTEQENDFDALINSLDMQKKTKEAMKELEKKEEEMKMLNLNKLEEEIKGSLTVTDDVVKEKIKENKVEEASDLDARRKKVLAKEEKERIKEEKRLEKERRKEERRGRRHG